MLPGSHKFGARRSLHSGYGRVSARKETRYIRNTDRRAIARHRDVRWVRRRREPNRTAASPRQAQQTPDDGIKRDEHGQRCRASEIAAKLIANRTMLGRSTRRTPQRSTRVPINGTVIATMRVATPLAAEFAGAIPAELLTHRLQKNAEGEEPDRPVADPEREHGTEDDAPGILEPAFCRLLISPPASWRARRKSRLLEIACVGRLAGRLQHPIGFDLADRAQARIRVAAIEHVGAPT
jgi:hypothetical protein